MAIVVQKYGGSSVATEERIENVAKKIRIRIEKGDKIVAVVSAMGKTTDNLIKMAKSISPKPHPREMDMLLTTGEQISIALLSIALNKMNIAAKSFNAFQLGIITTKDYTKARIKDINSNKIENELKKYPVIIVAGFQGITEDGDFTTLGRGGSDTSAVAIAAKLKVNCEIFSDVPGIYTCDPKIFPEARKLSYITYDDMLELSSLGAKVLHSRAVELAKKYNVPLYCASSFTEEEGTWVVEKLPEWLEEPVVTGATIEKKQMKITIYELPEESKIISEIFKKLAKSGINVDMISMFSHGKKFHLSFTVLEDHKEVIKKSIKEVIPNVRISFDGIYDKISIVGVGMKSSPGVAAKFFTVLSENSTEPVLVTTSEIKISSLIPCDVSEKILKKIAQTFNLGR